MALYSEPQAAVCESLSIQDGRMDSVDREQLSSFTAPKPALGIGFDVLTLTTCAYCHPDNKVIEMEGDGEGRTGGGKKYD